MRNNIKSTLVMAMACAGLSASAATTPLVPKFDLSNHMYRSHGTSAFNDTRSKLIEKTNQRMLKAMRLETAADAPEINTKPTFSINPCNVMGDMDAPGGKTWFYTGSLDYDYVKVSEYFTDAILRAYTFTIYDEDMKVIGTITDEMDYREDEVRVPQCELAPVVTRKYFNTDDKYEVVIGLAINAGPGENHYRSVVYSLDGLKDEKGFDTPVFTMESLIGDVLEAPAAPGDENYFMTFAEESYPDVDDSIFGAPNQGYWDAVKSSKIIMNVYAKAADDNGPRKVFTKEVPLLQLPGDQQYTPYIINLTHGDDAYFVFSYYKDTFYNPYYSYSDELTMRDNNTLIIELYKVNGSSLSLAHTTEIPVVKDAIDEALASYYSVGNMRYRGDVDFDNFGTSGDAPAFIITKDNYMVGSDDSYLSSYYVYGPDGKLIHTLFEGAETAINLSDIPGQNAQEIFVTNNGSYAFHFVDVITGKTLFSQSASFTFDDPDMEPEALTSNIDRTKVGDSYMYAIELRVPTVDENEHDNARVMWLDANGQFSRIDEIDMGTNVHYAQCYIASDALQPTAFTSDAHHEYLVLVKRGHDGGAMSEELIVSQAKNEDAPEGKILLEILPDSRGVLNQIMPYLGGDNPRLLVGYYDQPSSLYAADIYALPLDGAQVGITDVIDSSAASAISFDGVTVRAAGADITVYDLSGVAVARGYESASMASMAPGVYIAKAGAEAKKILVK